MSQTMNGIRNIESKHVHKTLYNEGDISVEMLYMHKKATPNTRQSLIITCFMIY